MRQNIYDYIIIGCGPAGLQLGYFMERSGKNYLILESSKKPGAFFHNFPRHRQLISINKRYTGFENPEIKLRTDWNSLLSDNAKLVFSNYSSRYFPAADELVKYLKDFAKTFKLNIKYSTHVHHIEKDKDKVFMLSDKQNNIYKCRRLIIATGLSKPYLPNIPGIELAESYSKMSINPQDYTNQRILIIGKGNSAFETADNLIETTAFVHVAGPSPIKLAWRTHYVGHLRAVNNNFLDTYQLKSQNAILDGNIIRIKKNNRQYSVLFSFTRANEIEKELIYDRVIACTGFRFDDSIFSENCRPELAINNRFPLQSEAWESANVSELFFAGTLMQQRDYRKSTSGFIHGFRYCTRSLFHMLEQRFHNNDWPSHTIAQKPSALMEAVVERVNITSALWQQFEFLGDLITLNNGCAHYYKELPVDYIQKSPWAKLNSYYIITLEYGPDHAIVDPFDIEINRVAQDDSENAFDSQYLHPVVRHYSQGRLIAEHHMAENLENEWNRATHKDALKYFFAKQLSVSYFEENPITKTCELEAANEIH